MEHCVNKQQIEKYFKAARHFDKLFPENDVIPNCLRYNYVPHDYYSDYNFEKLDNFNESEIMVVFSTFYHKLRH